MNTKDVPVTVLKAIETWEGFVLSMLKYEQVYGCSKQDAFDRVVEEINEHLPEWRPKYKDYASFSAARSRKNKK